MRRKSCENREIRNLTSYPITDSSDEDDRNPLNAKSEFENLSHGSIGKTGPISLDFSIKIRNDDTSISKTLSSDPNPVDFWSGEPREENWADETSIWGVASHCQPDLYNITNAPFKRKNLQVSGYIPKRARLNESSTSLDPRSTVTDVASGLQLSVHCFIKPSLRKTCRNAVPKKLKSSLQCGSEPINRIGWCSPDYSHLIVSASTDSHVRVIDVFSEKCLLNITSHSKSVKDVAWSSCGRFITSCGYDKNAFVTDVESGSQVFSSSHVDFLTCTKFCPSHPSLVVAGSHNVILAWDTRDSRNPIRRYKHKDRMGQVLDICFLSDSTFISSCDFVSRDSADRCIMVWDFNSAASISNEIFHEKYTCPRLCPHPFKKEFVAQTQGDYIAQFSSEPPYRMNKHKQYNRHKVSGYSIGCDINNGGGIIASGGSDGQVVFYNYQTTNIITKIGSPLTGETVLDVAWHPVLSSTFACSTWNGRVEVWQ